MSKELKLPSKGDVVIVRRLGRGVRPERAVVVTGVGRDSFLGCFVNNTVIENQYKPTDWEWRKED